MSGEQGLHPPLPPPLHYLCPPSTPAALLPPLPLPSPGPLLQTYPPQTTNTTTTTSTPTLPSTHVRERFYSSNSTHSHQPTSSDLTSKEVLFLSLFVDSAQWAKNSSVTAWWQQCDRLHHGALLKRERGRFHDSGGRDSRLISLHRGDEEGRVWEITARCV